MNMEPWNTIALYLCVLIGLALVVIGPVADGVDRHNRWVAEQLAGVLGNVADGMRQLSAAMPAVAEATRRFSAALAELSKAFPK